MGQVLSSFSGVRVTRVIDRSSSVVAEHAHAWPVLSVFVLGGYRNATELGEIDVAGPSVVLYQPRAAHANRVGSRGFEQIEIEFDPAWLGMPAKALPVSRWTAGPAMGAIGPLMRACLNQPTEVAIRLAVGSFLAQAETRIPTPAWLGEIDRLIREAPSPSVRDLARRIDRHPAWLGVAYARHRGESLQTSAARLRVERAAMMLRETDEAPAMIAAEAGFSDQSHMIRVFRRLLGRTPSAVRADRDFMRSHVGRANVPRHCGARIGP